MKINRSTQISCYLVAIHIILLGIPGSFNTLGIDRLKVGVSSYNLPFSFIEKYNTEPRGFCADPANILACNIGFTIEAYAVDDAGLVESLTNGRVDIIIGNGITIRSLKNGSGMILNPAPLIN